MPNNPLVSLVSINYNSLKFTLDFIKSVSNLNYDHFEVVLVDNGSTLPLEKEELEKKYSWLKVIISLENLGFTGGNNLAIKHSTGEYILIINNDTELDPNLLQNLIFPFTQDSLIGIVCPKIYYFDSPNRIQYAGFTKINPITGRNSTIGEQEIDLGQYSNAYFTQGAHGAAMMVKREILEIIGDFYEPYFLYYEEVDLTYRIKKAGYKVYFEPSGKVWHKESSSIGKFSPLKTYYLTRNRILFMKRNSSKIQYFLFSVFFWIAVIPKNMIHFFIKKSNFDQIKSFWTGTLDGFRMPPFKPLD